MPTNSRSDPTKKKQNSNLELIRPPELHKTIQFKDPTLWRWERDGRFPKRIKIGPNSVAWLRCEVEEWLKNLAETR